VEDSEFQAILDHEQTHWWYRGRLRVVLAELARIAPPAGTRILDAGCGSGRVLAELAAIGEVSGVDANPLAVAASRARGFREVVPGSVEHLPYPDGRFDLVTCLDVIEHTPNDVATLRELQRVTAPGGRLLVTVPAYPALWSAHDERNRHYRRYRRGSLHEAAAQAGWVLERHTHFNSLLLLPAAAVRLASRIGLGAPVRRSRSDLSLTPQLLDPLLELPLRIEAALIARGATLPAGLSLLATFRRAPERRLASVRPLVQATRNAQPSPR
jgi:SAM-dependent methyltransferase